MEQKADANDDREANDRQRAARLGSAFKLSRVLDAIAGCSREDRIHQFPYVVNNSGDIAARNVALHDYFPLHLLTQHLVRPRILLDFGQRMERHFGSTW